MAPLKVYVASATANPETKYRVQRTLMILDGLGIPFDSIDITKPEHAEQRRFMREKASKKGPNGAVLPPQFFYEDEYLGDYEDFDTSVEADTITEFLRLLPDAIGNRIRVNDANKCVAALFSKSQNKA
ncbi:Protein CBG08740 [Caenorhabditis briggsae]|uniref:Protein CBG08740 n=1 Tax=Caenorhabditis briggsae TaxID=6238 RepID=A8X7A0_CAEBR|nr:Protein CBG08740 [Caenorhabditis briggsae]CAP28511.2 Protein CBG08740 [Caenorhabditis briggsae]